MFKFVQETIFLMRKFLILIAFVCCSAALYGQVDTVRLGYSVQGNVVDAVTGRPMESVHVSVPGRHYATVTNADGDFTIKSDRPVPEVVFSYLGYRTLRQKPSGGPLRVRLTPESMPLAEASIITGDPREIVQEAIYRIQDNYSRNPELLECFYRETVRKRNRYIYVSEAVSRLYKTGYDGTVYRDRAALEKSRVLLSQRRTDTLSVKMQGGPTQAVTFDVVKNPEILFDKDELALYEFEMGMPTYIGDRLQFVIHFHPGSKPVDWALYNGTLYIDRELLSFTRIEMSLDMTDQAKATRMMVSRSAWPRGNCPSSSATGSRKARAAWSISGPRCASTATGRSACSPPPTPWSTNSSSRTSASPPCPSRAPRRSVPWTSSATRPPSSRIPTSGRITTSSNPPKAWSTPSAGSGEGGNSPHIGEFHHIFPAFTTFICRPLPGAVLLFP